MIAQLSQSVVRGRPACSIIGVRWAGFLARNSGVCVLPQTSTSSNSRPAARTKIRTVRLLTLGFSTCSVIVAIRNLLVGVFGGPVLRERRPRPPRHELDGVGQVDLDDVSVAPLLAQLVRLEQDVGVGVAERRLEPVRRELDQEAQRVLEVDRVHEAAVLDAAVADAALVEALDGLP